MRKTSKPIFSLLTNTFADPPPNAKLRPPNQNPKANPSQVLNPNTRNTPRKKQPPPPTESAGIEISPTHLQTPRQIQTPTRRKSRPCPRARRRLGRKRRRRTAVHRLRRLGRTRTRILRRPKRELRPDVLRRHP